MSIEVLDKALDIPPAARIDRRVAKSLLAERGELSSADRRLVEAGLERLSWRATLKPINVSLPAFHDAARDYAELVIMSAELRAGARAHRIIELIHRAIAHPLVLLTEDEAGATLSIGLKRRHEREAGRVVVERLTTSPLVSADPDPVTDVFLASLPLAAVSARDLWSLHTGWAERAEAFLAARITGVYRLPANEDQAEARRVALGTYDTRLREVVALRKAAVAERQLNRRIDLSREVARADAELAGVVSLLT